MALLFLEQTTLHLTRTEKIILRYALNYHEQ